MHPRVSAGLPAELDLHCLRHSYITHLVEFDYPERFVSEQAGHRYASTTAIYTGVSDDYRSRLVTTAPQRLSMDTLAALCDILGATPNDLIEVQAVNVQVAKAAGGARLAPSARRTVVRRPGTS